VPVGTPIPASVVWRPKESSGKAKERLGGFHPFAQAPPAAAANGASGNRPIHMQQLLSAAQNDCIEETLVEYLNARGTNAAYLKAAAFLSGGRDGGAWLNATPALPLNRMHDASFRTALKMRMLVPFATQSRKCHHHGCSVDDDVFGHHAFRCKGPSSKIAATRHKLTNGALLRVCRDAGLSATEEVAYNQHFDRKPNGLELLTTHRMDVLVTTKEGDKLAVDTTVRHPIPVGARRTRGTTAKIGDDEKLDFISDRYNISKDHIKPFSIETYGVMGEIAKDLLRKLAKNKAGDDKVAYARNVSYYRSRIAVAVQRGNHLIVDRWLRGRVPIGVPADVVEIPNHGRRAADDARLEALR